MAKKKVKAKDKPKELERITLADYLLEAAGDDPDAKAIGEEINLAAMRAIQILIGICLTVFPKVNKIENLKVPFNWEGKDYIYNISICGECVGEKNAEKA